MTRSLAMMFACGLWVAVPLVLAVGCGDDSNEDHNDDHADGGDHGDHEHEAVGPPSGATCSDPGASTLTYENFGEEFFSKYCLSCHSSKVKGEARMKAPADHNFDTYEEIELLAEHIDQKAAAGTRTNTSMPLTDPKPTLDERKKLGEWIACGLKE
jgi:hypothetical protein